VATLAVAAFIASPVLGALIYAAGVRLSNRVLRVVGGTVAIGTPVVSAALLAISLGD
jgi:hypothetical protein